MKLYSTNDKNLEVEFQTAVFQSMPQDKGLYMPTEIPVLDPDFIQNLDQYSLPEIAFKVGNALVGESIPAADLKAIIDEAINFEAPIVKLHANSYVLELFHGPSLAFKDFGARFMSRVMSYFLRPEEKILDVLVATSGDTGAAVALGFLGVPNTRVTILFPAGKVSNIQELQLCTNGENIHVLEVDGTFDDCQHLVKQAFADQELNAELRLTSANSINISRLIPQTFYYFNAYAQMLRQGIKDVVFAVPSGNFGNLAAGLLAYKMGLPVRKFIAATNINDTVPRFLETGLYEARPSVHTYANAMDVGAPSNWVRIMDLFNQDRAAVMELMAGYRYTDVETIEAIHALKEKYNYIACPHSAIAWLAAEAYQKENSEQDFATVFLSTAHPCKFPEAIPADIVAEIEIPAVVETLMHRTKKSSTLAVDYAAFKQYLLAYTA
jgi:threonine synthase